MPSAEDASRLHAVKFDRNAVQFALTKDIEAWIGEWPDWSRSGFHCCIRVSCGFLDNSEAADGTVKMGELGVEPAGRGM